MERVFLRALIFKTYLLAAFLILQNALHALPAQVIVVRHGEKDPVTRQLTKQGEERAAALAYYLTQTDYLLQFGQPAAIFAARHVPISDRLVPRPIQTIMPTAQLLQLPVHSPFNGYQVHETAHLILNSSKYDGKNIIICWSHSSIHDLLNAFGYQVPFSCSPPNKKYPDCRFDLVFVMTFPAPTPLPLQEFPYATVFFQQLLFGDLTCEEVCPPFGSYPPILPPSPAHATIPPHARRSAMSYAPISALAMINLIINVVFL